MIVEEAEKEWGGGNDEKSSVIGKHLINGPRIRFTPPQCFGRVLQRKNSHGTVEEVVGRCQSDL